MKDEIIFELPPLYSKSSSGKIKFWEMFVTDNTDGSYNLFTHYGFNGGKTKENIRVVSKGKNIGRANETTARAQALFEARSKWKKQLDKGYTKNPNGESNLLLPMLALNFRDRSHDIHFPCYSQRKLNGVRCLAEKVNDSQIVFHSRQGKDFGSFPEISSELLPLMQVGEVWDGELYVHGWSFQRVVSAVKDVNSEDRANLQLWIYDVVDPSKTFEERFIPKFCGKLLMYKKNLVQVATYEICNTNDIDNLHNKFVLQGYEGIILRNKDGKYKIGGRSKDLQKLKNFVDDEFEIIDGFEDRTGGVVFWCMSKGGKFKAKPRGTLDMRKKMLYNLPNLIGKQLTVRYQNYSDEDIPIFPIGISVRDYEN